MGLGNWSKEAFGQTFLKMISKLGGKTSVAKPASIGGRDSKAVASGQ